MTYGDFKDLNRRTYFGIILHNKASNIAKNAEYDEYQMGLASMVLNFWLKKHLVEQLKVRITQANY